MKFNEALNRYWYLREYVRNVEKIIGKPNFYEKLNRDIAENERKKRIINFIYPVGKGVFVHIYRDVNTGDVIYHIIEPPLTKKDERALFELRKAIVKEAAHYNKVPMTPKEHEEVLNDIIKRIMIKKKGLLFKGKKLVMPKHKIEELMYYIVRDLAYLGKIQPFLQDPYLEDVGAIGTHGIFVYHKYFGPMPSNVRFENIKELNEYLIKLSTLIDRRLSLSNPIIDGVLPDGSRINIIYGTDVSKRGSAFTIRKFEAIPLSVTQLVKMNTMSAEEAAYLWLAIEHGMNVFVCGETASGKTTTLRALSVFINPSAKVFSVEDTPEIVVPHENWERLITREKRAEMYDLLKAALRSRPNYILVGEIRGREGYVAFQAMQTGHPVMATFHAENIGRLIQRLTSNPINIPETFIDNLNIAVFQRQIYEKLETKRRVINIDEIEGYYRELNKVVSRRVFQWNNIDDIHEFLGKYNSYILEEKIARMEGLEDPKEIYKELDLRTKIVKAMVETNILDFGEVFEMVRRFYAGGLEALPPKIVERVKWV